MSGTANPRKAKKMKATNTDSGDSAVSKIRPTGTRRPWNAQIAKRTLTRSSFKNLLTKPSFNALSIPCACKRLCPWSRDHERDCPETRANAFNTLSFLRHFGSRDGMQSRPNKLRNCLMNCLMKIGGMFMGTLLQDLSRRPGEKVRFLDIF